MPKYQQIMRYLNPKTVIAKTVVPHDTARGKYLLNSSIVRSYLEFENVIIDYTTKHMRETLGGAPPIDFVLHRARGFLEASLGWDNSVFIGMSGIDGGMHLVLNKICGGFKEEPAKLLIGGPMMGQPLHSTKAPIIKGSGGILALTHKELALKKPSPCIRCASCVNACPCGLLPLEMASRARAGDLEGAADFGLMDCISCGSCSYVCPSHIPH